MARINSTDSHSQLERELIDLCRGVISTEKITFERTLPIQNWLQEHGDQFPAANELSEIAGSLNKFKSKLGKKVKHRNPKLMRSLHSLVESCDKFLRLATEDRRGKRTGNESVGRTIRLKYILVCSLVGFAIYAILVNAFLLIFANTWLVPMSLGEAVGKVVMEQGHIHLFTCLSISTVAGIFLAFREFKSFKRIVVTIESFMTEHRTYTDLEGIPREEAPYQKYVARFDEHEVEIPLSIGRQFANGELVVCGLTTTLFRRKKKLWKPFESI